MIQDDAYICKNIITKSLFEPSTCQYIVNLFHKFLSIRLPNLFKAEFNDKNKFFEISDSIDSSVEVQIINCIVDLIKSLYTDSYLKSQLLFIDANNYNDFYLCMKSSDTNKNKNQWLISLAKQVVSIIRFDDYNYRVNFI